MFVYLFATHTCTKSNEQKRVQLITGSLRLHSASAGVDDTGMGITGLSAESSTVMSTS